MIMVYFLLILFFDFLGIYISALLSSVFFYFLPNGSMPLYIFSLVINYIFIGFLICILNKKFFSYHLLKPLILIILSSILILILFLIMIGNIDFPASIQTYLENFLIFLFHVQGDPLSLLMLFIVQFPVLFIVTPLSLVFFNRVINWKKYIEKL